ncbi:hypothetical protein NXX23_28280 [Bacteroides ovatus]|nr:hypothetical protein [Bacteroides ovatus]
MNDGTYRYLVNHATPAPTIEGHYDEGSKEFTITPSYFLPAVTRDTRWTAR